MPTRNDRLSAQNKLDVIKQSIKEIEIIAEVEESGQEIERLPFELAEQMEVVRLLGDGNSAVVVMVQVKETREEKALKIIKPQNIPNLKELIETELTIMSKIDHEFIVRMYEHWFIDDSWYISLELIPEGDLFEALRSARYFDERSSASLIKCLSSALSYLHSQHIVHRDVKMENLLIFYDYSRDFELPYLKLADFGLATEFGEDLLYDLCGTPSYVSVETLSGVGYREKSDLWSCGVITYILLCGFPPFQSPNNDQEELFGQILKAKFFFPSPVWDKISFSARNLICNMLTVNVDERYSAEQVYNNDWVALLGNVTKEFEDIQEFELEDRLARNASAQMPFEDLSDDSDNSEFYYQKHRSFDDISQSSNINKYESPIHRQRERSDSFLITKR
uniref:Protein kinase domain-containing protein n=1 Tax=Rhabditophanes sp. KR3021 TaxID=114890 RepID=A0AC35TJ69_9BILA